MAGMSSGSETEYHIPIVDKINNFIKHIGQTMAWVNVALIGVILASVYMRYGVGRAMVTLEELTWYLYAVGIMFGLSYGIVRNSHIRVDILHMVFPPKLKHFIEILGILFLLLPFAWVVFHHSLDWVWSSYSLNESSSSPQGLPYRWIIKSVIPLSFFLILLAAISRLIQSALLLRFNGESQTGGGLFSVQVINKPTTGA